MTHKSMALEALFGQMHPIAFMFCMLFAAIGAWISLNHSANKRNVDALGTPKNFSYRVLIEQNWRRIVTNVLLIYVAIRFTKELSEAISNGKIILEPGYVSSFLIGVGNDRIYKWITTMRKKKFN